MLRTLATLILACCAVWILVFGSADAQTLTNQPENEKGQYEPTVESLRQYRCPKWFRDAKFGIYMHWGPCSINGVNGWYGRNMYIQGHRAYEYHVKTFGHPSEVGYKDLIPLWKAEKFDPDELVALFKEAGAKYFTPCAVHHDNFDLWDSKHHRWNAVEMGPKKDIIGLLREATLKHGLRFGVTTHLARAYSWFNTNKGSDTEGSYKGVPYDGNDPKYEDFYFEKHGDTDRRHPLNPPKSWRRQWANRMKDLIDHYHPDHLYFDGAIPFQGDDNGQTGMEVIAYYYNHNMQRHGGRLEGAMFIKHIENHGRIIEGATGNAGESSTERADKPYTAADIRFTRSKDGKTLYAIVLGWPEHSELTIKSLAEGKGLQTINSIELFGHDGKITWERTAEGLKIVLPDKAPCEHAVAFSIR